MTYDPWIHIAGGLPVWAGLGTQPCVRLSGEFAMCTDNGEASAMGPGPGAATSSKLSYQSFNTKIVKIPTTSTECRMQSHLVSSDYHPSRSSRISLRCCGSVLDQFPENAKPLGIWTPDVAWQDWIWLGKTILRHFHSGLLVWVVPPA